MKNNSKNRYYFRHFCRKVAKRTKIVLGFIAVESMIGLIFITILLKMQVFVF